MSDFKNAQRVRIWDGTNDLGTAVGKELVVKLGDGTDTALIDGSGNLQVLVGNSSIPVTDNGGSLTVDGSVAVSSVGGSVTVVDGGGSITVDGSVTISSGSVTVSATDLDIRDLTQASDSVAVWTNTAKDGTGTDYQAIVDTDGHLQVDVLSGGGGGYQYQDGTASASVYGNAILGDDGTNLQTVAVDSAGQLQVDVLTMPTVTVQDGGGSITVDGSVSVSSVGGSVTVVDGGGSITVDGSVTVSATDLDIRDIVHTQDSIKIGDGSDFLAIDSSGRASTSLDAVTVTAVPVSKNGTINSASNPIFVTVTPAGLTSGEVHSYDTSTAIAANASDDHDYTVTSAKTLLLKSVIVAASGAMKCTVQVGPLASLVTKAVIFTSGSQLTQQIYFDPPIEVPDTSTGTVRVTRRNDDNQAMDVYSTIIGVEI